MKEYINEFIFPVYLKNDKGHNIEHINSVIEKSMKLGKIYNLDLDICYIIAAFHDIGHHIDKDNHEVISGDIFFEDEFFKKYLTVDERILIKEAIYDHRTSLKREPRSIYGKVLYTADNSYTLETLIKRTHSYSLKHFSDFSYEEMIERAFLHFKEKFNSDYLSYLKDEEMDNLLIVLDELYKDYNAFTKKYDDVIKGK